MPDRPNVVDRAALIEAMRQQYFGHEGAYERMLDEVLPLIADAIEPQPKRYLTSTRESYDSYCEGWDDGMDNAERLVRSFAQEAGTE